MSHPGDKVWVWKAESFTASQMRRLMLLLMLRLARLMRRWMLWRRCWFPRMGVTLFGV